MPGQRNTRAFKKFSLLLVAGTVVVCAGAGWWVLRGRTASSSRTTSGDTKPEVAGADRNQYRNVSSSNGARRRFLPTLLGTEPSAKPRVRSTRYRMPTTTLVPEDELSQAPVPRADIVERGMRREPTARELAVRRSLEGVTVAHPGVNIMFVNCQGEQCRARAQSSEPAQLDKFLAAARRAPLGSMEIRVRERPTAFNGMTFQADIKLASTSPPPDRSAAPAM